MSLMYLSGIDERNSELDLLVQDNLYSMGDAITKEIGSLAWCEAYAIANVEFATLNFLRLLSNQFSPQSLNIYARRFAKIYNLPATGASIVPNNLTDIQKQIALKDALFGTPNSFSNVYQYLLGQLGNLFIDIEFNTWLQPGESSYPFMATPNNGLPIPDGYFWYNPLATMFVRVWQPRDNEDNLLVPTATFNNNVNLYKSFVQEWIPSCNGVETAHFLYFGNDGYGINSFGVQGNADINDGYAPYGSANTVSGLSGYSTITGGAGTDFPDDFKGVTLYGWHMPIEIVDDDNVLQTFHVHTVGYNIISRIHYLEIDEIIPNNITSRSYRLLGIHADMPGVTDGGALLSI